MMDNQTSVSFSPVDAILVDLKNGVHPEKIKINFPWVQLTPEDRQTLIEKACGFSHACKSLLRLLGLMVEDVPVEYRWDQVDILFAGFQYLGWNEPQKQIALIHIEQALSQLSALVENQRPDLRQTYHGYRARFYLLRGSFFYEKVELFRSVEDFKRAAEAFRQAGNIKQATRLDYLSRGIAALVQEKNQPLETGTKDDFLFRFLRQEEKNLLNEITEHKLEIEALDENIRSKKDWLLKLEVNLQDYQKQIQELQQQLAEYRIYENFVGELRHHISAPLWQEVLLLALQQGEVDELTKQAIERLSLTKNGWDQNLLTKALIKIGRMEEDVAEQTAKGFTLIEQAKTKTDENVLRSARWMGEGWKSVLDALERKLRQMREFEDFTI